MKIETYLLPTHWACALINCDATGLDDDDLKALNAFEYDMVKTHGKAWCVDVEQDSEGFMKYHDAEHYGVLACDVSKFLFDVTPEN